MADDIPLADPPDRERIDVNQKVELQRWAVELGCAEGLVIAAVMAVGPFVADVKRHLCKL
jgi:hypothetical protein